MAFLQVQFYSKVLNVCSTVNVILPEADQGIGVDAGKVSMCVLQNVITSFWNHM